MSQRKYIYKFYAPPYRYIGPYLPITFVNPHNGKSIIWDSLIDTGADASLIPESLANLVGHELKADGVQDDVSSGISEETVKVWRHTFNLQLLSPGKKKIVWRSPETLIDCKEASRLNPLLGTLDFLCYFTVTIDYPRQRTTLTWDA